MKVYRISQITQTYKAIRASSANWLKEESKQRIIANIHGQVLKNS